MPTLKQLQDAIANATNEVIKTTTLAQERVSALNRCNCGKGKFFIPQAGNPSGTCTPYRVITTFPNLANVSDCIDPPFANECKTDCCSKQKCETQVNDYNLSIGYYNAAIQNLKVAEQALQFATENDPEIKQELQNQKDQDKNRQLRNGIIWFVVISAVLGVAYWIWRKTRGK